MFEWLKTTNNSNVDFNNKVMETLTAITENNEEDKQDLANLKQSLIDGTFNVKYLTWAIMATNDENGNRIIDTYATIERLTQVLEALTQEISDRKAADDLEKNERKEETSAIINSVNQEISDRTNAVSVLNNLITAETENRTSEDEKVLQYAQSVNEALGNAKTDLQGKIDSEAQTRLANDNEIKASITSKEDSLKALINSVKNELNGYITTLNNRVNNLPTNYVFDTYESMTNDLLNASNTKYKVGDTLFIKEVNKPDYWVSAILSTKGTYGYYELSEQESKVDLSNYIKISELSREAIEEKFLETVENGTKSFAARSFTATNKNSGIDVNNYTQYGYDGVSFRKNGVKYPISFPQKQGIFALTKDIPQALKNPFALTINGQVYDGSSAVSITTETITEHDFVRFWHAGIQIQNDGTGNILRFSAFDTELEEFSPHISCQYDGPQYYWVWKFPQISGTFAMESQIPTKLSQLTNDGNYQTNTSDLKDNTTTFTTASSRSNVASGEKLSVSFGKIAKYFNDLKAVAFSGSKADVGLGNVDNTADKDKPISTATKTALDKKANTSDLTSHTSNTNNPHNVTKSQVGLGNVDNTSDADKPISNATQQALNNKANSSDVYTKSESDTGLNKSLYNLGYYDTMAENSDGTYTITRQTGYIVLDGVKNKFSEKSSSTHNSLYYNHDDYVKSNALKPSNTEIVGDIICNLFETKNNNDLFNYNEYGVGMYTDGAICVGLTTAITTIDEANAYLVQNPISIQYKLATSYTEKVEANHYARYNQRFILEHNKSEAERSCNLLNTFDRSKIPTNSSLYNATLNSDGSYTSTATHDGRQWNYSNSDFRLHLTKGKYCLSGMGTISTGRTLTIEMYDSNSKLIVSVNSENNYKDSFTLTSDTDVGVMTKLYDGSNVKIMLNEGSIALPYQPYNQNKHITNYEADFLKTESDRSANLFNPNNVEYGSIDYDGTNMGEGHARARSFYIPVSPNTYYSISSNNSELLVYELYQYDSNKLHIEPYIGISNDTFTFLTRNNTYYIRILFKNTTNTDFNLDILSRVMLNEGSVALPYQPYEGKVVHEGNLKTINGNSIVGSGDLSITPGIFTKLGNKTNFSFDSGSYLVVANNGLVTVTGTDPLNVGSSANKKFVGIFMVTIAGYGGGQSVCVNTEEVFLGEAASATISGPMFTIYKLN